MICVFVVVLSQKPSIKSLIKIGSVNEILLKLFVVCVIVVVVADVLVVVVVHVVVVVCTVVVDPTNLPLN